MKDYINQYGKKRVKKFQEGGVAEDPGAAQDPNAAAAAGGSQEEQLQQALMQVIETQDPELALQVCNAMGEMMGLTGGTEGASAEAGGAPPQGGTPMARRGMKTKPVFSASLKG